MPKKTKKAQQHNMRMLGEILESHLVLFPLRPINPVHRTGVALVATGGSAAMSIRKKEKHS